MGDFSKSGSGTTHGNTAVIHKIKICFQVFPGKLGTDAQRGIPDVPYEVEMVDSSGIGLKSTGKTAKDGSIELNILEGETAILTIFDTDYPITVKKSFSPLTSSIGVKQRLSLLGYYNVPWQGNIPNWNGDDKANAIAVLNYQADSSINVDGNFNDKIFDGLVYKTTNQPADEKKKNKYTAIELQKDAGV